MLCCVCVCLQAMDVLSRQLSLSHTFDSSAALPSDALSHLVVAPTAAVPADDVIASAGAALDMPSTREQLRQLHQVLSLRAGLFLQQSWLGNKNAQLTSSALHESARRVFAAISALR